MSKKTVLKNVPVEKNKCYTMTIDDLGSEGEGIGKIEGFAKGRPIVRCQRL